MTTAMLSERLLLIEAADKFGSDGLGVEALKWSRLQCDAIQSHNIDRMVQSEEQGLIDLLDLRFHAGLAKKGPKASS
jgi:hypothetical protein